MPTAAPSGKEALRQKVAHQSYREGAATLSPRTQAPVGLGLPTLQAKDPIDAPAQQDRDDARDRLHKWYVDAKDAVTSTRNQMGRAAERFAEFAGREVRRLKSDASRAGSLATLLFGPGGRAASLLAGLIVEAVAKDPGPGLKAALAGRLDSEARAATDNVAARYEAFRLEITTATTAGDLQKAREHIHNARPGLLPTENQLYRDLILQLARDTGMHVWGRAPRKLTEDDKKNGVKEKEWWISCSPGRPFALDGPEVADELNALAEIDPRSRTTFDTEMHR